MTGSYDPRPVDVWGMGATLYVMIAGDYPFGAGMVRGGGYHETVQKICSEEFVHKPLPASCSPELHDLLRGVLCVDASRRLRLAQISRHPWLAQGPAYFPALPLHVSPRPHKDWATFWPPPPPQRNFFDEQEDGAESGLSMGSGMFGSGLLNSWGSASSFPQIDTPGLLDPDSTERVQPLPPSAASSHSACSSDSGSDFLDT